MLRISPTTLESYGSLFLADVSIASLKKTERKIDLTLFISKVKLIAS